MLRSTHLAFALVTLAAVAAAPAALAQCDFGQWTAPVVCQPVLSLSSGGTLDGDTLYLPAGRRTELHVQARDQHGSQFPQERFRFGLDLDRSCNGVVELVSSTHGVVVLRTGQRSGRCTAELWIPGNMNLDRQLQIVVGRTAQLAPSPSQTPLIDTREGRIAQSIFRALLAREPDADWVAAAAIQVRQGDAQAPVRAILASSEFAQRRSNVAAEELLRGIYQGLLGREPDAGAYRTYLDRIRRGAFEEVVVIILRSSEFNQRHGAAVG
jgi:hypothetical protein